MAQTEKLYPSEATGNAREPSVSVAQALPTAPTHLSECGVPSDFLAELAGKILLLRGRMMLPALADAICLPRSLCRQLLETLRADSQAEIAKGGSTELHAEYQLTERGRNRATAAMNRCGYAGPAPVSLEHYSSVVAAQSMSNQTFSVEGVQKAFKNIILQDGLVDQVGAALNSGRAMLLYGPAGSGKTHLAELLAGLLKGNVLVPHAIYVGGEVIQVFDPLVHRSADEKTVYSLEQKVSPGNGLLAQAEDKRWVVCRRPLAITGGELTLAMLDMQYDPGSRIYQAPPHVKANGGVFVIDDLGRQLVSPRELMNRWIVPLDRQQDYLALHSGYKFMVPFDLSVVFSTNLHPTELADEAFLRRFGYKIFVGPLQPDQYRDIAQEVCEKTGVVFDSKALEWLLRERHHAQEKPLLACYPRDLLGRAKDFALYENRPPVMTQESLSRAWSTYFVHTKQAITPDSDSSLEMS